MKKTLLAVGILGVGLLSGCGLQTLQFEEKQQDVEIIEEVLENRLEAENPAIDLDVTITEDAD